MTGALVPNPRLVFVGPSGALTPVPPAPGLTAFNYRLGVPMLSPEQPLEKPPNRARLRASTFDWYVPVVQRGSAYLDVTRPVLTRGTQDKGTSGDGKWLVGSGGEVSIHLAQRASATIAPLSTWADLVLLRRLFTCPPRLRLRGPTKS